MKALAAGLALLCLVLAIELLTGKKAAEPMQASVRAPAQDVQPSSCTLSAGEVRAIVRDEIANAFRAHAGLLSSRATAADNQPQSQEPPAPNPEEQQAFAEANRLVDRALSRREWDDSDKEALAPLMRRLSSAHFSAVTGRLAGGFNTNQLAFHSHGSPF